MNKRGGRVLALALSVALALGLAEAGLRLAFPAQTRYYVHPPRTTRVSRPSQANMPGVPREARFTVSTQGIRARELGPDAEYRVLAVGGSTTECVYLDDALAWPALVGEALPATADGRPVWVGNVGKAGTYSRDHVVQLEHLAAGLPRLDTVLVLVGVNDLTLALAQGDHYAAPPPITDPESARRQVRHAFAVVPGRLQDLTEDELAPPLYKRSALFQLARRTRARLARRVLVQDEYGQAFTTWRDHRKHAGARLDRAPDLAAPLAEYRRNLVALADLAAAREQRLVLLTQPVLWRDDLPEEAWDLLWLGGTGEFQSEAGHAYYTVAVLAETMRRYNEVVLDVCRERGLACLDLAAKIPRDTTMFYDDCHYTAAGSRAVAAAVAERLRGLPPWGG